MAVVTGVRPKHPSGRPVVANNRRNYMDGYGNRIGPKTARLQQKNSTTAIGFHAQLCSSWDDA